MVDKKSYDVEILEVRPEESVIKVRFHSGSEKEFPVIAPAQIGYAKVGKASIGIVNDQVNYVRGGVNSTFKPNNSYKKPYNPNFNKANEYKPEKKTKMIFVGDLTTDEANAIASQINSENKVFSTQTHIENGKWYLCFYANDE
jgi:hypothetical protein